MSTALRCLASPFERPLPSAHSRVCLYRVCPAYFTARPCSLSRAGAPRLCAMRSSRRCRRGMRRACSVLPRPPTRRPRGPLSALRRCCRQGPRLPLFIRDATAPVGAARISLDKPVQVRLHCKQHVPAQEPQVCIAPRSCCSFPMPTIHPSIAPSLPADPAVPAAAAARACRPAAQRADAARYCTADCG